MKKVLLLLTAGLFTYGVNAQVQMVNGDFEDWNGSATDEPANWHSFLTANCTIGGIIGGLACGAITGSDQVDEVTSYDGSSAAEIQCVSVFGAAANGNLTTGLIQVGSTDPLSADNHNQTIRGGSGDHNAAFTGTPDSVSFWYKTVFITAGNKAKATFSIHSDADYQDPGGNAAELVGNAVDDQLESATWTRHAIPVTYTSNGAAPAYLLATLTTNPLGGQGDIGDLLTVDNIVMIYNVSATYPTAAICGGDNINVDFSTSGETTADRMWTAQLSDASGSFASPTNIGTLNTTGTGVTSGTINCTIPTGIGVSGNFKIRVIADHEGYSPVNTNANLTINAPAVSIAPVASQQIVIGANGVALTATESDPVDSREWLNTTTSGSGYVSFAPTETMATYTPNFAAAGTYYVVCQSTVGVCDVISNEVEIEVIDNVGINENEVGLVNVYSFEKQMFVDLSNVTLSNPMIKLFSTTGQVVLEKRLNSGALNTFNVNVPQGVYIFNIVTNDNTTAGKVVLK